MSSFYSAFLFEPSGDLDDGPDLMEQREQDISNNVYYDGWDIEQDELDKRNYRTTRGREARLKKPVFFHFSCQVKNQ